MSAQQDFDTILTAETFNKDNVTFGKPYDIKEYNIRKINVGYSHPGSTDDEMNVIVRGQVISASEPNEKCSTHSSYIKLSDESAEFLNEIENGISTMMFKNRKTLFDGMKNLDKLTTQKKLTSYRKKPFVAYNEERKNHTIGLPFDVSKNITIEHTDAIPEEQRNSTDPLERLGRWTEVLIAININAISINGAGKWNLKANAIHFHCLSVPENTGGEGSGKKDPSSLTGYTISDIDVSKLVFKDIDTNQYGGMSLPIKYPSQYGKEVNLALKFEGVKPVFVKNENTDKKGKTTTKFSVALNFDSNELEEVDNTILNHLFKNQKKFASSVDDDIDVFSDSFNGSIKEKDGKYTLWSNLYVRDNGGNFDFDGKIFQANGKNDEGEPTFKVMDNDDIMEQVINSSNKLTANMSIYLRYVWLGESYSVKWYVSKIQLFTKGSKKFNFSQFGAARDEDPEEDEFDGATGDMGQEDEDPTAVDSGDESTSDEED